MGLADICAYPPKLPIPSDTGQGVPHPLHASTNSPFPYFCKFWTIASEVLLIYRRRHADESTLLSFALSRYHRLLALVDSLPDNMKRGSENQGAQYTHVVLQFQ
jgi:hypothetical protein